MGFLCRSCLGAVSLILASCQSAPPLQESPAQIREIIAGTWQHTDARGRVQATMIKTFFPDGTAKGWIQDRVCLGRTTVHPARINFTSRWRIEGDVVVAYDIHSNRDGLFKPTDVLRDRLLRITPGQMDFIDLEHREHFSLVRVQEGGKKR